MKPLTEQFGWDRGALSGAFAVGAIMTGVMGLTAGRLTDKYGPKIFTIAAGILLGTGFMLMSRINALWQAYLIWGLLIGAGIGCSGTSMVSSIPRWFTKKRGMAISITIAGFNFGAVIGPLIIQWLVSTYDWRRAFLVIGLIPILVNISLAQFLKRDPRQIGLKPYGEEESPTEIVNPVINKAIQELSFAQIIKSSRFWVFGALQFTFGFCMQIVIIHIAPHATDIGISALVAASILSISAGSRVIGNLTTGFLSELLGSRRVMSACFVLLTLGLVWLLFARDVIGLFVFAVIFGATSGGINPLLTLVPAELFGLRNLGIISGAFLLMGTMGGSIGSPLAGYIFDVSKDYRIAFGVSAAIGVIAVVLSLILLRDKGKVEYSKI